MAAHRRGRGQRPRTPAAPRPPGAGAGSPDTRTWAWMALCVGGVRWAIEALWGLDPTPSAKDASGACLGSEQSPGRKLDPSGPKRGTIPAQTSGTAGARGEGSPSSRCKPRAWAGETESVWGLEGRRLCMNWAWEAWVGPVRILEPLFLRHHCLLGLLHGRPVMGWRFCPQDRE